MENLRVDREQRGKRPSGGQLSRLIIPRVNPARDSSASRSTLGTEVVLLEHARVGSQRPETPRDRGTAGPRDRVDRGRNEAEPSPNCYRSSSFYSLFASPFESREEKTRDPGKDARRGIGRPTERIFPKSKRPRTRERPKDRPRSSKMLARRPTRFTIFYEIVTRNESRFARRGAIFRNG